MGQQFVGTLRLVNQDGELTLVVDPGEDSERGGQISVLNVEAKTVAHLDGRRGGQLTFRDDQGTTTMAVDGQGANLFVGSDASASFPKFGSIFVRNHAGEASLRIDGDRSPDNTAYLEMGTGSRVNPGSAGTVIVRNKIGNEVVRIEGGSSRILVNDANGSVRFLLDAATGSIGVRTFSPSRALHVQEDEIHSGGARGGFSFGNRQTTGFVDGPSNGERWVLYASGGSARLWSGSDKVIFTKDGDLQLAGGDCAEEFEVDDPSVDAGSVMVLADDGTLELSTTEYDERVVGVVSGAGTYKPGLVLDRREGTPSRRPVALMGKAFCKVDAGPAPVRTGDLLTTGGEPGHAMRVTDRGRALGAVLGKALQPLGAGTGLIPVLVTLQ